MSQDGTQGLPGHFGALTPDEERALQESWIHLLRLCGVDTSRNLSVPDKRHEHQQHLDADSSAGFHNALWNIFLGDHPDVMILRFLRARKWDVDKAMAMLVSNMHWRHEHQIDEDINSKGDSVTLSKTQSKHDKELVAQFRSGKAYVRGSDKNGRPVFIIKVRLHDLSGQATEVMEAFVLYNIETIRTTARHPQEKVCLVFDLTGFGLKNMDFHVVKFLAQTFEARYPEYLASVLVHNAPFIFWGAWAVIKPWLDPVIASKIHFTSGTKGLLEFVSVENLQKSYGGKDDWEYKYIEPSEGENDLMKSEKKNDIHAERDDLIHRFEGLTLEWAGLDPTSEEGRAKEAERNVLADLLVGSFWRLDPYVRARTYYHRVGIIGKDGKVDYQAAAK